MSKRGYERVAIGLVAGVFMLALSVLPSQAQMRGGGGGFHGGGGGFHGGGFQGGGGFRGGHSGFHHGGFHHGGFHHGFRHHHFGSRVFVGVGFGAPFWYPYGYGYYPYGYPYYPYGYAYPYPSYYADPVVVESSPPAYVQQAPPAPSAPEAGYWYYCSGSQAYYPYVKECPGGWIQVAPQGSPSPAPRY